MSNDNTASTTRKPFIQLVSFNAKDKESRDKLWSHWLPGFSHVLQSEVGSLTSTYEGFFPAGNMDQPEYETEIMAFETYESESEFNRLHMTAPAVMKFLGAIDSDQLLGRPTSLNFLQFTGIGFHTRGEEREKEVKKSGKKPWTLVVSVIVKKSEDIEKLLSLLSPLAQFVTENEPNTLTYAIFRSKSNSNEVLIFERYVTRADLEDVHWKSSQFQTFAAKLGESDILLSKTARTYEEQQVGVWGKE